MDGRHKRNDDMATKMAFSRKQQTALCTLVCEARWALSQIKAEIPTDQPRDKNSLYFAAVKQTKRHCNKLELALEEVARGLQKGV